MKKLVAVKQRRGLFDVSDSAERVSEPLRPHKRSSSPARLQ